MATKSKLSVAAPKVANQGGMGKANVQPAKIHKAPSVAKPGKTAMNFSKQPAGTKGTNKGAK